MFTKPTPIWITIGAMALAAIAGCVNAVGFLGVHHQALSHMSGTVTTLSTDLARSDWSLASHALLVVLFFFLGCVLSGLIIRQSTLRAGRRYGVALMCESAMLFAATYFLRHDARSGDYLAAMACGLQNAMATSYSGAVIRTTHVTGIVTDLGIALGLAARGERVDWRRTRLYLVLLTGFLGGGVLGASGYLRLGYDTLLFPAIVAGITGATYAGLKHYHRLQQRRRSHAGSGGSVALPSVRPGAETQPVSAGS